MKKVTLFTIIAVSVIAMTLIGCGDDDSPTGGVGGVIGDTTSETFVFFADSLDDISFDAIGNGLDLSFELLDLQYPSSSPSKLINNSKSAADTTLLVSNSYTYSNGWHIFDYSATIIEYEDTTTVQGIDSIQTLLNNVPVQNIDTIDFNSVKIRAQYAFENNYFGSAVGHVSLDISATTFDSLGIVTISGNSNDTLSATFNESFNSCSLNIINSVTVNDVIFQIDVTDDCPTSGSLVATQDISLNCIGGQGSSLDSLNIDGVWTFTVAFNGTSETLTITNGTNTWSVTEACEPNAVGASLTPFSVKE